MKLEKVCVYCASSRQTDHQFFSAARALGKLLANNKITVVYGGGAVGSMGHLADAALAAGGKVTGIIPRFMYDLEWAHQGLTELHIVDTLHSRKKQMIDGTDAVIALPGGSGTLEELLEAITWKRLGIYVNPIIIVNIQQFFDPLIELFNKIIEKKFMNERHGFMWTVVNSPEDVISAITNAPSWSSEARHFAAI